QAEDGIRDFHVTGVQTCALPIFREWITLHITYDPGRLPALVSAVVATVALVLSLVIRRRRVWIRVSRADGPATIEVGGLARTEEIGRAPGRAGGYGAGAGVET